MENIRFKLVTGTDIERFEERLNGFIDSLDRSDLVVDVKFSAASTASGSVEFCALVHYQRTENWE